MKSIIEKFYTAFANCDAETMASCYHDNIEFQDPGFGVLKGAKAGNMWRMLCASQKGREDFKVEFSNIEADEKTGKAHWEAHYTFSQTGRRVHNKIDATFEFEDGKIIKHVDHFDLHKWSSQAIGLKGSILGWTSFFKKKLQQQTSKTLARFEDKLKATND